MKISSYFLIAVGGAVIGAASGFAWRAFDPAASGEYPSPVETVHEVNKLPAFSYPDLDGRERHSSEFGDKVLVVNFWATWCPPCVKETPQFVQLQREFAGKVQFIGIAIDDADPVREFAASFEMNYPVLLGDIDAVTLSRQLGNRFEGLPFTVVASRAGNVVLRHSGGLERERLEPVLRQLTDAG